jgi:hypothetical protein
MADSVTASNLPTGFDLYGAYVDGAYKNYAQVEALFPGKVVGIAVFSTTNDGIVGDCESGDMTPQSAVTWVQMRRAAGVIPTIYCSEAAWSGVQQAFTQAGTTLPNWWIAAYPGIGPTLYPGSVAHQWIDHGPYDESVVADFWPGVDKPLPPTPPEQENDTVTTIQLGNQLHVFGVLNNAAFHWWRDLPGGPWQVEPLPA